ncbi:tripartite motif-containing protein 16-like [Notolabrus celidotus]|uniref:tripartite motif-containing protein 16-like n=1 Tax=Notolabrus celidotus TaxID=1203425 RepID=UPI001490156D|nr:tripartite motif-containing protein 16-like [Notolabrus celidotus]
MAEQGFQVDQDRFCCSICLDLLKAPVTISCGHSYCMSCIKSHWDGEDLKTDYSCPQCRQIFTPRPVLGKNTMLANLVEGFKKTGLQDAPSDRCYARPGDVVCDFCTGRKRKALKSCLQCLVSYCEEHLQPHYESAAFGKHKLVDPDKKIQDNICPHHNEMMKIFCRTDQECICYLCSMEGHKDHDTVSAAAERTEKQNELWVSQQNIQQRIQSREEDVKMQQLKEEAINRSADQAVQDSEEYFKYLIQLIRKRSSDLEQQIRTKQNTEVSRVRDLGEKLDEELTDLRRTSAQLELLSNTEDNVQFLHSYTALPADTGSADTCSIDIGPVQCFEDVTAAVFKVKNTLQNILSDEWERISLAVRLVDVLPQPEPKNRDEFLQYSYPITLDGDTATGQLSLSAGVRRATGIEETFSGIKMGIQLPFVSLDSPSEIFQLQVLSREHLPGRCYWEVEWDGVAVSVAVTHKCMRGVVHERGFGYNDRSWALMCFRNCYQFIHDNIKTFILSPLSNRVGVYLDQKAGTLSFYAVSETMTLLKTVQTRFTEPLYAGLFVGYHSTAEFK